MKPLFAALAVTGSLLFAASAQAHESVSYRTFNGAGGDKYLSCGEAKLFVAAHAYYTGGSPDYLACPSRINSTALYVLMHHPRGWHWCIADWDATGPHAQAVKVHCWDA